MTRKVPGPLRRCAGGDIGCSRKWSRSPAAVSAEMKPGRMGCRAAGEIPAGAVEAPTATAAAPERMRRRRIPDSPWPTPRRVARSPFFLNEPAQGEAGYRKALTLFSGTTKRERAWMEMRFAESQGAVRGSVNRDFPILRGVLNLNGGFGNALDRPKIPGYAWMNNCHPRPHQTVCGESPPSYPVYRKRRCTRCGCCRAPWRNSRFSNLS